MRESRNTHARYIGCDDWGRPLFQSHSHYYCSVDTICPAHSEMDDLVYRLNNEQEYLYIKTGGFDGEPSHPVTGITVYWEE